MPCLIRLAAAAPNPLQPVEVNFTFLRITMASFDAESKLR
jgi:hypothetical protein